jgi:hypothetical protein
MIKEYQEKYYASPEVQNRVKEYYQEYNSNPETIEKRSISRRKYETSEKGKERRKQYTQTTKYKERKKLYNKSYRQTPEYKERKKLSAKLYMQTPEYKQKIKLYRQTPEYKQKIKLYRQTPEYKELRKQWRRDNVASVLSSRALRRARKRNSVPKWINNCPVERKRLHQIYLLSRIYAKADGIERHVDHMWPLSDGGPHWSGNLQVLTKEENLEKGAYSCPKLKKQMKLNLKEAKVLYAKAA